MKIKLFVPILVLLVTLGGAMVAAGSSASTGEAQAIDQNDAAVKGPGQAWAPTQVQNSQAQGPIIIDHTCTDLSKVPDYWIEQAKTYLFHYAHTSHGSQILSGMDPLAQADSQYDYFVLSAPPNHPPTELPGACGVGQLCMYDGQPGYDGQSYEDYITPDLYWESSDGITRTRVVADTGLYAYSMWSWCGQQSDNSEETVQQYLDTLAGFEADYPNMRFILMTGHTDGGGATLAYNNTMVRQYAQDHDMVLFDFADIETYDPLGGGPYDNNGEGTCAWCVDFCANHPEYCTDLPDSCAHSEAHPEDALFCKLKAQAFWWMLARLAGWDGVTAVGESQKTASTDTAVYGDVISYTVVVQGLAAPLTATASLTDEVPSGLTYIAGTLASTGGVVNDSAAPVLHWSGALTPTPSVTVTYAARVTYGGGTALLSWFATNHAVIGVPGYETITRTATVTITPTLVPPDLAPSYKAASPTRADYGEHITFTVGIFDAAGPLTHTLLFTDTIQDGLAYVPGSLDVTSGVASDAEAPTLTWSGILSPTPAVTITYVVTVTAATPRAISNTASIAVPGYETITRTEMVMVNSLTVYLPVILRNATP